MIDWVHAESPFIDEIVAKSGVGGGKSAEIEEALNAYISGSTMPPVAWIDGTTEFASLSTKIVL
jgi:hypothetical protein